MAQQRDIKFRVWDGVDYMTTPFTLHDLQTGHPGFTSDTILMQYTGLKDVNGREIYEGDILTANYAGSSDREYKNVVQWNDGECAWNFANAPLWTWENITVIGNIYENPELTPA